MANNGVEAGAVYRSTVLVAVVKDHGRFSGKFNIEEGIVTPVNGRGESVTLSPPHDTYGLRTIDESTPPDFSAQGRRLDAIRAEDGTIIGYNETILT